MAEQELVENALQRIAGVLPDQSHRDLLKELLDQGWRGPYNGEEWRFYEADFVKARC